MKLFKWEILKKLMLLKANMIQHMEAMQMACPCFEKNKII